MTLTYRKTILPDGLRIVSESDPTVRSISIGLWVDIGSRDEPSGYEGISHFVEHMAFKGTTTRSPYDIVSYIESVGGVLNAFTTRENTCFVARVMDTHLARAVEILADIVHNSRFDKSDIAKEKQVVLDEINEIKDTPADLVHDLFAETIFDGHPLGKPILGTFRTVRSFTQTKILDFLQSNYERGRMLVAASGNLDHLQLVDLVSRHFRTIPDSNRRRSMLARRVRRVKPRLKPGLSSFYRKTAQTHVCIGGPAMTFDHPQRAALLVLNSILGGSMSSRLFQRIREDLGLAYTIFSYADFFEDAGVMGIYFSTEKQNANKALTAVFGEIRRLTVEDVPSDELEMAKEQLRGSLILGLENTSHRMNRLAKHELLLGEYLTIEQSVAELQQVNSAQVRSLAARLLRKGKFSVVSLGPVTRRKLESAVTW